MKRIITLGLLALMLALPVQAFAADSSSTTTESLTIANTISMVAPGSATYAYGDYDGSFGQDFSYGAVITVLASNNPTGITVTAKVDPWTGPGGITTATNKRQGVLTDVDCTSNGQTVGTFTCPTLNPAVQAASGAPLTRAATTLPAGTFADNTTVVTLATADGPLANADLGVEFYVDADEFSVGGNYASAIHYTASTNAP